MEKSRPISVAFDDIRHKPDIINHLEYRFINDDLGMVISFTQMGSKLFHTGQPYRTKEGRIIRVLQGTGRISINLIEYEASARKIIIIPDNALIKAVYGLKQITAKYRHHKDQLGYTRLYAPFSGYIQKRLFEAHETVGAGMPVLSMISNSAPEVEINLPAAEYIRREQFDRYRCTFDIYPEQTYELKLISVTPKANANQLYTMRLQLITDNRPVPSPGMNTMVTILCNNDSSRNLSVPGSAVLQKDGKTCVFVYNPSDSKVHSREVTLVRLLSNGRSIIASDGLQPGDQVVSAGIHHIKDGETVTPLPAASDTNIGGLL